MDREKGSVLPAYDKDFLDKPPHILLALNDLVRGEGHLTSIKQEQLSGHLAECLACQNVLKTLLAIELDQDRQIGLSEEPIWKLISRLSAILEKTNIRNDIPAYIEALELLGEKEAKKRYARLTTHLQNCKSCQSMIEGTQALKRDAEQAGLITPLRADTSK
jgi:hypothetical protein